MLHSLLPAITERLKSVNCPFDVSYGPTRPSQVVSKNAIVFSLDDESGDSMVDSTLCKTESKPLFGIKVGCKCRIYAKSYKPAGTIWEHQDLAILARNSVLCAIRAVTMGSFSYLSVSKLGFLSKDQLQLEGLEAWPGVVYEIQFGIPIAIFETKWDGDYVQQQGNVDDVENTLTAGE